MTTFFDGVEPVDAVNRIARDLFQGWGYNFYKVENMLRADDLLVRAKVSALLGAARASVEDAEAEWRRERLPPPSRAHPLPDPEAVRGARALDVLGRDIGVLEGRVRALPVPEADRMSRRFRGEADTLARLLAADMHMVGHAELLRAHLAGQPAAAILAGETAVRARKDAIETAIASRSALLT